MPYARKGAQAAESAARSSFSGRVDYFRLKPGDPALFIRMVDDYPDWQNADVHMAVPTKPAPSDFTGKWPASMSATCQNDQMFRVHDAEGNPLEEFEPGMGNCFIHNHYGDVMDQFGKPKSRANPQVFALCVLREPVMNDSGAIIRMRDKTEEWTDPKGGKRRVPAFRVISQRWGNFFSPMKAGAFLDDTVVNKDWRIERDGNDYHITPLPPTPDHAPGTPSWQVYTDAIKLMNIDVFGMLVEQASPAHYEKFFIPGDDSDAGAAAAGTAGEEPEVDQEELDAVRQKLLSTLGQPAEVS